MPYVSCTPSADRFFARLEKFECECPNCGRLIFASLDRKDLPSRLQSTAHLRRDGRMTPHSKRIWNLVWNPYTQRLACPWCHKAFMAGLLLFPVAPRIHRQLDPPPDVDPTAREWAEIRRKASGWYARELHAREDQHVNRMVTSPCSCPERGWVVTCPVHGDPNG